MRKNEQNHRALLVALVIKDRIRASGRGARSKNSRQSPPSAIRKWRTRVAPAAHLGRRGQCRVLLYSVLMGDLKVTRKRQFYHKLVIGNWSITSLTRKEHKLVEKPNDAPWMLLAFLRLSGVALTLWSWKLFFSGVESTVSTRPVVTDLSTRPVVRYSWHPDGRLCPHMEPI